MHRHIIKSSLFGSPSDRTFAIFLLAGILFLPSTGVSADTVKFFNPTAYEVPYDAPPPMYDCNNQPENELTCLAIFAWQEFIALNWPSSYNSTTNLRGQPDTTKTPIQFAQPDNSGQLVWQTYMHRVEIYPMANVDKKYPDYPTMFDYPPQYNYCGKGVIDDIPKCGAYNSSKMTWSVDTTQRLQDVRLFNNLDETTEIDLATLFTDGDPAAPGTVPPPLTPFLYGPAKATAAVHL